MKKFHLLIILCFTLSFLPTAFASESGLVIDEFRTRSLVSTTDEYLTIANYSHQSIDLTGYTLEKLTTTLGKTLIIKFPITSISPKQKIKIASTGYGGEYSYIGSILADANNALVLFDAGHNPMDAVTYGNVNNFLGKEGSILSIEKAVAYTRLNGQDSNNNAADFVPIGQEPVFDQNASKIILNEILPDPKTGSEWFEIYNPTSSSINLGGLKVCDKIGSTHCYLLPSELIASMTYRSFDQSKSGITLNNDGDILELQNSNGLILSSTNTSYGKSCADCAFARFGTSWKWTSRSTRNGANILMALQTATATTKKTKVSTKKSGTNDSSTNEIQSEPSSVELAGNTEPKVMGLEATQKATKISRRVIGFTLIIMAVMLIIGYTSFENREKIYELYHKFRYRNN